MYGGTGRYYLDRVSLGDLASSKHARVDPAPAGVAWLSHSRKVAVAETASNIPAWRRIASDLYERLADAKSRTRTNRVPIQPAGGDILTQPTRLDGMAFAL